MLMTQETIDAIRKHTMALDSLMADVVAKPKHVYVIVVCRNCMTIGYVGHTGVVTLESPRMVAWANPEAVDKEVRDHPPWAGPSGTYHFVVMPIYPRDLHEGVTIL